MVSYVLLGINWGSYQTVCVSYAMDIAYNIATLSYHLYQLLLGFRSINFIRGC